MPWSKGYLNEVGRKHLQSYFYEKYRSQGYLNEVDRKQ